MSCTKNITVTGDLDQYIQNTRPDCGECIRDLKQFNKTNDQCYQLFNCNTYCKENYSKNIIIWYDLQGYVSGFIALIILCGVVLLIFQRKSAKISNLMVQIKKTLQYDRQKLLQIKKQNQNIQINRLKEQQKYLIQTVKKDQNFSKFKETLGIEDQQMDQYILKIFYKQIYILNSISLLPISLILLLAFNTFGTSYLFIGLFLFFMLGLVILIGITRNTRNLFDCLKPYQDKVQLAFYILNLIALLCLTMVLIFEQKQYFQYDRYIST